MASSSASPSRIDRANFAKKLFAGRPVEIPDGAAQKKDQQVFAFAAARRHFSKPLEIRALEADDADFIDVAQFLLAAIERAAGNIDRIIVDALAARQRLEQPARFLAAAAAEFRDDHPARAAARRFPRNGASAGACRRG